MVPKPVDPSEAKKKKGEGLYLEVDLFETEKANSVYSLTKILENSDAKQKMALESLL